MHAVILHKNRHSVIAFRYFDICFLEKLHKCFFAEYSFDT